MNKKALSTIIAVILLISLAVFVAIIIQIWYFSLSNNHFTSIQKKQIENLENIQLASLENNVLTLKSDTDTRIEFLSITNFNGLEMCSFGELNSNVAEDNLIAWWTFDDSSSLDIFDISGNSNNGIKKEGIPINVTNINGNLATIEINWGNLNQTYNSCILNQSNEHLILIDNYIDPYQRILNLSNTIGLAIQPANIICENEFIYKKTSLGYSLYFDGKDDYVEIPDSNLLDIQDNLTIFIRYKNEKLNQYNDTRDYKKLISKGSSSNHNYLLSFGPSPHSIYIRTINLSDEGNSQTYNFYSKEVKWNTIVASISSQDKNIYFNNKKVGKPHLNSSGLFKTNNINLTIGSYPQNIIVREKFKGEIDEIRLYNRVLSEDEIQNLYEYTIRNLISGKNQIDLSSCNLSNGDSYEINLITNISHIKKSLIAK
jgi:hypothetical protein